MGFDWQSFATGFMNRTTEILQERQAEAKQFEQEQKAAAERNAATISRRRAIADQVTGYANYLTSNGVSQEQLQAVIASGPRAIESLTERVQEAVQRNNGRPLGSSDVSALITMPEGFVPLDMTTQEFIDQTYGLGVPAAEPQQEQEFGFMDRLFGRDQMARAEGRVRETPFMEGMSVADINRAAMQGDYQSLVPGTFAAIAADTGSRYRPVDQGVEFAETFETRLARLRSEEAYEIAIGEDGGRVGENTRRLIQERLGGMVTAYADEYGDAFLSDQAEFIESYFGPEYVTTLIDTYTLPTRDEEEEAPEGSTTRMPEAGEERVATVDGQPAAMVGAPTMGQPAQMSGEAERFTGEQPQPNISVDAPDPSKPDTVLTPFEAWQRMTRAEREAAGLPTSDIGAEIYFERIKEGLNAPSLDEIVGPAGTGDPQQNEDYQKMVEMGFDDETIAVLNSHGADMMAYLEEKGANTPEEINIALNEFGAEKGVVMPFDKSGLINVFLPTLQRNQ
jgi:hypothetical protein